MEEPLKENQEPCTIADVVGSDFEDLKDWGYEDENYPEEDDTLFAIESNFPPSNMTEKEWNDSRR